MKGYRLNTREREKEDSGSASSFSPKLVSSLLELLFLWEEEPKKECYLSFWVKKRVWKASLEYTRIIHNHIFHCKKRRERSRWKRVNWNFILGNRAFLRPAPWLDILYKESSRMWQTTGLKWKQKMEIELFIWWTYIPVPPVRKKKRLFWSSFVQMPTKKEEVEFF